MKLNFLIYLFFPFFSTCKNTVCNDFDLLLLHSHVLSHVVKSTETLMQQPVWKQTLIEHFRLLRGMFGAVLSSLT